MERAEVESNLKQVQASVLQLQKALDLDIVAPDEALVRSTGSCISNSCNTEIAKKASS